MKKILILSLPLLGALLCGVIPVLWGLLDRIISYPSILADPEYLLNAASRYSRAHIVPGTHWVSLPTLGPIAFCVGGIVSTLWLFGITETDRAEKSAEK